MTTENNSNQLTTSLDRLMVVQTEGRVWVTIAETTIGFDNENFIDIIKMTDSFKYSITLREQIV